MKTTVCYLFRGNSVKRWDHRRKGKPLREGTFILYHDVDMPPFWKKMTTQHQDCQRIVSIKPECVPAAYRLKALLML